MGKLDWTEVIFGIKMTESKEQKQSMVWEKCQIDEFYSQKVSVREKKS